MQRDLLIKEVYNSELISSLKVTKKPVDGEDEVIIIEPGKEYSFKYYDADTGSISNIIAGVICVYEDKIKVKFYGNDGDLNNCIHNNLTTYDYNTVFIPISNLLSVTEYTRKAPPCCDIPVINESDRKGIYIMLLGISATILKAIIVRLALFDDNAEEAIRYVDLEAGKVYDISYEAENTIYESRVKVMDIIELDEDTEDDSVEYVKENVGLNNAVYYTKCTCNCVTKEDFMLSPPVKKVKIVVDTSEAFTGRYEEIMLHTIRDCKLVEE